MTLTEQVALGPRIFILDAIQRVAEEDPQFRAPLELHMHPAVWYALLGDSKAYDADPTRRAYVGVPVLLDRGCKYPWVRTADDKVVLL